MTRRAFSILWILLAGVVLMPESGHGEPAVREVPIMLKASQELPRHLRQGPNFRVSELVRNDGWINLYEINTDYGTIRVEGTAELQVRVNELRALHIMEEMKVRDEFGQGAVEGVKAPVKGAAKLVTSPIETGGKVISGTGRFLSNVGRSIISGDPHQDNVLKTAIGYDAAKRGVAYELGVNPYSSYKPMTSRLGQLAQAKVAGGATVSLGTSAVSSGAVGAALTAARTSNTMRKLARDNPPGTLEKLNRSKLDDMGVDEDVINAFFDNHNFDPQEETLLIGALESMSDVDGRELFVTLATTASAESTALFWRLKVEMAAAYHARVAPVDRIINVGGWPKLQTRQGKTVVLGPVDHVFLTQDVKAHFERDHAAREAIGIGEVEYWITGRFDPEFATFAATQGITLFPGANERLAD